MVNNAFEEIANKLATKNELSLNELNAAIRKHQMNKANNTINNYTPSQYNVNPNVNTGYVNNINTISYQEMEKQFKEYIDFYYKSQVSAFMNYREEKFKLDSGKHYALDMNQYNYYKTLLINNTRNKHLELLNGMKNYLSMLPVDRQIIFHKLAIEKQLEIMHHFQQPLMSDRKKLYDARMNILNQNIARLKNELQEFSDKGNLAGYNAIQQQMNSLNNELKYLNDGYMEFMNMCYINNNGYMGQRIYDYNTRNKNNAIYNQDNYRNVFETEGLLNSLGTQAGVHRYDPSFIDRNLANINTPYYKNSLSPVVGSSNLPGTGGQQPIIKTNDYNYNYYTQDGNFTYNPNYGTSMSDTYNYQNNLFNKSINDNTPTSLNYQTYLNTSIRDNRRFGYIPESFGFPENNPDYFEQLIWVTPVPDPTQYTQFSNPPMWYLTPEALGYENYVEASSDIVKFYKQVAYRSTEDCVRIRIMKESEYLEELEKEEKEKEPIEEDDNRLVIRWVTQKEIDEENEKKEKREEKKQREAMSKYEYIEPDFTDDEYVKGLEELEYIPQLIIDDMKTYSIDKLKTFTLDGILYLYKYRTFNRITDKQFDELFNLKLNELEEKLIEVKGECVKEELLKEADNVAAMMANELGLSDDITILDEDTIKELKQTAWEKMQNILDGDIPDFNKEEPDENIVEEELERIDNLETEEKIEYLAQDDKVYEYTMKDDTVFEFESDEDDAGIPDDVPEDYSTLAYDPNDEESIIAYLQMKENAANIQTEFDLGYGKPDDNYKEKLEKEMGDKLPMFSNGDSINTAFEKVDYDEIEKKIELLKKTIRENLRDEAYDDMTMYERILYYREHISCGLFDKVDMRDYEPGLHKFFTNRGIFIVDNRDLSIRERVHLDNTLSQAQYNKYYNPKKPVLGNGEAFINTLLLPTMKPDEKKIYKSNDIMDMTDDQISDYMRDIQIVRKMDKIRMRLWTSNNMHPIFSMNEKEQNFYRNLNEMYGEYEKYTGLKPFDENISYAEWVEKVVPYMRYSEAKGKCSSKAIEIYNTISQADYHAAIPPDNWGMIDGRMVTNHDYDYYRRSNGQIQVPERVYSCLPMSMEPFHERVQYTCNAGDLNNKCYSTYISGYVDMTPKEPPPQFRGDPNSLYM